nr:immunoglobulin heavy chain junction region [Mus musculus]MBK4189439.1 immunoglobulin heavy chain junction region [Mus musculus]
CARILAYYSKGYFDYW